MPDDDLLIVAPREADTLVPEAGLVAEAGLETVPDVLRATLDARLDVFPMLMPPRTVPPDVRIVFLLVFLVVTLFLSVWALSP